METLRRTRDSKTFWGIINQVKMRNSGLNILDLNVWYDYLLESFLRQISVVAELAYCHTDSLLDSEITIKEIIDSLLKCKGETAPATDGIRDIFYKNLPPEWIAFLCTFFNKIM